MNDDDERIEPVESRFPMRRIGITAAVLLFVFLLGLIPMWLKARSHASSLAAAEQQIALLKMQNNLATSVISARRGDYEPARQSASQFFSSLRAEVDKGSASSLSQSQRDAIQPVFAGQDEIITLLARGDPASAERLSNLYVAYLKIMNT